MIGSDVGVLVLVTKQYCSHSALTIVYEERVSEIELEWSESHPAECFGHTKPSFIYASPSMCLHKMSYPYGQCVIFDVDSTRTTLPSIASREDFCP